MTDPGLQGELDELFGLPPNGFVAARNELASRLRGQGHDEEAARVRALTKPSITAWAVNQLARRHPEEMRALLDAGSRLQAAQNDVLEGADPKALRRATAERRDLVSELSRRAASILEDAGSRATAPNLDRISNTLLAGCVDEEARDALGRGRLTRDLSPGDVAAFGLVSMAEPEGPGEEERQDPEVAHARREAEQLAGEADRSIRDAEEAEAQARESERRAREAAAEAERARSAADELRARAEDMQERARRAAQRAEELL